MYLRWFLRGRLSRRLNNKKSSEVQDSQCLTCPLQFGCLFYSSWSDYFPLVTMARAIKDKTQLFYWDADRTRDSSNSIPNTAANNTHGADHRERFAIDHDPSLLASLQQLDSLQESSMIPTVQSMSITFGWSLCRVGSVRGGECQRLCVAGHWGIQVS